MKAEIITEKTGRGILIRIKGDVDMRTSPDVRGALGQIFQEGTSGAQSLFINLSQVRYMDSSGIATLVEALQTCLKRGLRLRLVDLSPSVKDVFELSRLTSVFEIFASMSEAESGV